MNRMRLFLILWSGVALSPAQAVESPDVFLADHCYDCHSGSRPKGGLDIERLSRDFSDPTAFRKFVSIHDRLASGEMPPPKSERPNQKESAAVVAWLDEQLFKADSLRLATAGRTRLRRMTVAEYENTLRDVLGLERLEVRGVFPADSMVGGFNKAATGLDISPPLLDAYSRAADAALTEAIATRSTPPPVYRRRFFPATRRVFFGRLLDQQAVLLKDMQHDPAHILPEAANETASKLSGNEKFRYTQSLREERKALYIKSGVNSSSSAVGLMGSHVDGPLGVGGPTAFDLRTLFAGPYRLRFSLWGFTWDKGTVMPALEPQGVWLWAASDQGISNGRQIGSANAPSLTPREYEVTAWLDAYESLLIDPVTVHPRSVGDHLVSGGVLRDYTGAGVALDWFEIEGPLFQTWPPESHRRIFGDLPITVLPADASVVPPARGPSPIQTSLNLPTLKDYPKESNRPLETVQSERPLEDARRLLTGLIQRAIRRPVAPAMVDPYVRIVEEQLAARACFEDAMRRACVALFTSPDFLLHQGDGNHDQFTLASRLSYWLWNSPPDAALLSSAESGQLAEASVLHGHVDRMLGDRRSDRFINDFTDQWLELRRIDETTPDKQLYPEFDLVLLTDMMAETRGFLREVVEKNLPARDLVDARFAMLTQRLARHYGIPGVDGLELRRVELPADSCRGGLLTQASILKITANGTTTTPVKRGVWVMDRLLALPPPPPPANVPAVEPDTRGATTVREQLKKHTADSGCATCHAKIDPPGWALEAFDPIGGFRANYRSTSIGEKLPPDIAKKLRAKFLIGPPVDPSGTFADGRSFKDIHEFKALITADPDLLARGFVDQMLRYATGTEPGYADRREIERILDATRPHKHGIRSIVHAIAASPLFYPKKSASQK